MTINTESEYKKPLALDTEGIAETIVNAVLDREDCPYECTVEILLTDDDSIRIINREQRNIDKATDVLSFPMVEWEKPADFDGFDDRYELFDPESGELLLGDLVVSMDHVYSQAEEYGHSPEREYAFLLTHGMLHLLGFDHVNGDEEREHMEAEQRAILEGAGFFR